MATLFGVEFNAADFRDGGHLDLVTINGQSLERFLAALYAVGLEANAMKGVGAISTTSLAIGTGSKAFTFTPTSQAWDVGQAVRAASIADPTNYMVGDVTATGSGTVTVNVTLTGGSGTHADWFLSTPAPGLNLPLALSQGGTGAATAAAALSNLGLTGAIVAWPTETPPTGWLECDGSLLSRTTYAALFAAIGTRYGVGDGSTTFALPPYRGKFLRGWANGSLNDPDRASRTDRGDGTTGDNVGTNQTSAYKLHGHQIELYENTTNTNQLPSVDGNYAINPSAGAITAISQDGGTQKRFYGSDSTQGYSVASNDGSNGGTSNSETRPININVMWIIKY